MEMSRLTRDETAEPVSRDQILRRERGQGNIHFPCSADHVQDWQPYPVDPYSCYMCDHTTSPSTTPVSHLPTKALPYVVVFTLKSRSGLYSVLSNIRTGPTDADAFRGHRLTTQKGYTYQKEIKGPRKVNTHAIIGEMN